MQLDFSADYLLWDNPEPVTLLQARADKGVHRVRVAAALRAQPSWKERQPTGGTYVGADLSFLLPGPLLAGAVPKPGDTVTDAAGTVWTILSLGYDQLDQVYQTYCVALALAYQLRDVCDVQRATLTYDAAGAPVRAWPDNNAAGVSVGGSTPYAGVACRAQLLSQTEKEERSVRGMEGDYAVVVGQQLVLTAEDRLKVTVAATGQVLYLDVRGQHQPQRIDELPILDARLAV